MPRAHCGPSPHRATGPPTQKCHHIGILMRNYQTNPFYWKRFSTGVFQWLPPAFGFKKKRRWTWAGVLERLKGIRRQTVTMYGTAVTLTSRPDDAQPPLLELLELTLWPRP